MKTCADDYTNKHLGYPMIVNVDKTNLLKAATVHSAAWKESHRAFCSPDFVDIHTPEHQQAYLQRKMDQGSRVYMLTGNEPIGIVSVTGSLIEDLYIHPDYQNMGYGTILLQYAIRECENKPVLWVLENNTGAERFYRRAGFRQTGRRNQITKDLDEVEFSLEEKDYD